MKKTLLFAAIAFMLATAVSANLITYEEDFNNDLDALDNIYFSYDDINNHGIVCYTPQSLFGCSNSDNFCLTYPDTTIFFDLIVMNAFVPAFYTDNIGVSFCTSYNEYKSFTAEIVLMNKTYTSTVDEDETIYSDALTTDSGFAPMLGQVKSLISKNRSR